MKIIMVGDSGTMGKHLSQAFGKEHEIIKADRHGEDIQVDITSSDSIRNMFEKVGAFDARTTSLVEFVVLLRNVEICSWLLARSE